LFRAAGVLVVAAARAVPRPTSPLLRLALGNLHRPGAPTARIVLSLGIGLSVMSALGLVEGNLAVEIEERLAEHAPADFFIDIQSDQLAGFSEIVDAVRAPVSTRCRCCAAASPGSTANRSTRQR